MNLLSRSNHIETLSFTFDGIERVANWYLIRWIAEQVLELNNIPYEKCDSPSHFIWVYHRIYIWTCYLGHFRESGSSKMSNKAIIPWLYFSINTNCFIAIGGQPHLSKLCAGGIWVVLRFVMSPLIKLTTLNWWYWLVDAGTEFLIFMEDSDSL